MKLRFVLAMAFVGILLAFPAVAMTLEQGRSSGAVGEKSDGYVAVLKTAPDVQSLVDDVNARRKQEYLRISKQNGQSVEDVAKLAAQQIVDKLPSGALYQAGNGWKKK